MAYSYPNHIQSRAEIVVGMIADAVRRACDRREFARFASECPGEADRLARDLNIDKASLMAIASQGGRPSALLNRRLRLLGIDPAGLRAVEPAVSQDLARCCALCGSKTRCAHDLARDPGSTSRRTYCPNEPTIRALGPTRAALHTAA
jgi:hypothetical protein